MFLHFFVVDILERKHRSELLFGSRRETASNCKLSRVLVGSEQSIPEWNVREAVRVNVELMMYGVKFRGLDNKSEPCGCPHIGMVEILACGSEEVVPERAHHGATQQRVQDDGAENCVAQNFDRMFVKGRRDLDSGGRMMYLMEHNPESVFVPQYMPPIKEEGSDEPADKALRQWHVPSRKLEDRETKYANPQPCRCQRDSELDEVHQQRTPIPALRFGKPPAREDPLHHEEDDGRHSY